MKKTGLILLIAMSFIAFGCQSQMGENNESPEAAAPDTEAESGKTASASEGPDRVTVQHILISFQGAIPEESITRTKAEAEALADDLYLRAKQGENFDALVKEYTDDQYPGIYKMTNAGIEPDPESELREYPRQGMVRAFGDISFSLDVGEIGMTQYDPETSKYGWHIIKRIE